MSRSIDLSDIPRVPEEDDMATATLVDTWFCDDDECDFCHGAETD